MPRFISSAVVARGRVESCYIVEKEYISVGGSRTDECRKVEFYLQDGKLLARREGEDVELTGIKGLVDKVFTKQEAQDMLKNVYVKYIATPGGGRMELLVRGPGGWLDEVHRDDTIIWAKDAFRNSKAADLIGEKCSAIDTGVTSPTAGFPPSKEAQSYHFSVYGYRCGCVGDTRLFHAVRHLIGALKIIAEGNGNDALQKALTSLGEGLHPLQDVFAHTDDFVSQGSILSGMGHFAGHVPLVNNSYGISVGEVVGSAANILLGSSEKICIAVLTAAVGTGLSFALDAVKEREPGETLKEGLSNAMSAVRETFEKMSAEKADNPRFIDDRTSPPSAYRPGYNQRYVDTECISKIYFEIFKCALATHRFGSEMHEAKEGDENVIQDFKISIKSCIDKLSINGTRVLKGLYNTICLYAIPMKEHSDKQVRSECRRMRFEQSKLVEDLAKKDESKADAWRSREEQIELFTRMKQLMEKLLPREICELDLSEHIGEVESTDVFRKKFLNAVKEGDIEQIGKMLQENPRRARYTGVEEAFVEAFRCGRHDVVCSELVKYNPRLLRQLQPRVQKLSAGEVGAGRTVFGMETPL